MKFTCEIRMDNAAFGNADELQRLLYRVADNTNGNPTKTQSILDSNGNRIGSWKIEDE